MRFATRTFLLSFGPLAALLAGSFWAVQTVVQRAVRDQLQASLRRTHEAIVATEARSEAREGRFLRIMGENATLKAGMQLLTEAPLNREARATVEDQLRDMGDRLSNDVLMVSSPLGVPLAGVFRGGNGLAAVDFSKMRVPLKGLMTVSGAVYQMVSTAIDQGDENLGILSVGQRLDLSGFGTPVALEHDGVAIDSTLAGISLGEVQQALKGCVAAECEVNLRGDTYLSASLKSEAFGSGYTIRSFQNRDAASRPVEARLRTVFLTAGAFALLAALVLSAISSRSIVKPLAVVVERLRESEETGVLPKFAKLSAIDEIGELTESFNRAGLAIVEGQRNLERAYVEFVGSMASALDARDAYTAGHSRRVSDYSCAIASEMGLSEAEIERLRVGALLHDIGKIGVPDTILMKPGKLTNEEFALLREHPTIGRRILEGVGGFQAYLDIVELHHENWNGRGYPRGLKDVETPLDARIVKTADAFDAMTSDRPYRRGMSVEESIRRLKEASGIEFDTDVVEAFVRSNVYRRLESEATSIRNLAVATENAEQAPARRTEETQGVRQ